MPVKLNQIASNIAHVTLQFGEDSLNIEYYPLLITDEMLANLLSFTDTSDESTAMGKFTDLNEMLASILKSWDLLEDDGETTIELSVKRMAGLSPVIKMTVVQAIMGDIRPETVALQTKS